LSWILSAEEVVKATGARVSRPVEEGFCFDGVGTDTRKSLHGKLFIALKGDNFDAHEFLSEAQKAGAKAALVHRRPEGLDPSFPLFEVDDSLIALQALATYWRLKHKFLVLGVTGSNGKTTTKEFAKAVIGSKKRTYASQGSFNNHWGVPISLLSADPDCEVVVQEMGMNHKGEIAALCAIARPDVVLCTMVGTSHIGELGSQRGVAEAKEEIYIHSPQASYIFNCDNEFTRAMYDKYKNHKVGVRTFSSFNEDADVHLRADRFDLNGLHLVGHIGGEKGEAQVKSFGRQNVVNLMAASSLALAAGLKPKDIWAALPLCAGAWGRNQWLEHDSGARVLFDAYNANPESMSALLKNLYELMDVPGRRILILG
jgi:UDP-N-acetylmuramoyl-tripeptide--D-alanyl-D-alanine ligase